MRWGEIIRRLVLVPPTLFGVAVVLFVLLGLVPGDPIAMMIPPGASEADIVRLRALYGLDQPILHQFVTWLGQVASGDFGRSISIRQSVSDLLLMRLQQVGHALAYADRSPEITACDLAQPGHKLMQDRLVEAVERPQADDVGFRGAGRD